MGKGRVIVAPTQNAMLRLDAVLAGLACEQVLGFNRLMDRGGTQKVQIFWSTETHVWTISHR